MSEQYAYRIFWQYFIEPINFDNKKIAETIETVREKLETKIQEIRVDRKQIIVYFGEKNETELKISIPTNFYKPFIQVSCMDPEDLQKIVKALNYKIKIETWISQLQSSTPINPT